MFLNDVIVLSQVFCKIGYITRSFPANSEDVTYQRCISSKLRGSRLACSSPLSSTKTSHNISVNFTCNSQCASNCVISEDMLFAFIFMNNEPGGVFSFR